MIAPEELKTSLPHTWPVFFAQHGNFTPVQRQAIPPILAGRNTLIIAATAAGKTEAALAPLIERHLFGADPAIPKSPSLAILYICPTRALVRDLFERLRLPCERLSIALAMKSGDTSPVSTTQPPTILITTPESTDSLLTRAPRFFTTLRALVIDEVHLFDNSPRGDHLRCLLRRIEIIQDYHQRQTGKQSATPMQRVALSATLPDPTGVAQRYLTTGTAPQLPYAIIETPGKRRLLAEIATMRTLDDLVNVLALRAAPRAFLKAPAPRKMLLFCNTRNEIEQVAAYLRQRLPFTAEIFVHYSNLDTALRQEVEDRFAAAAVAICVSTSTLELGIDIGSIDDIGLIGPPPTLASFLQRIGRGSRRRSAINALCLARSPLEELQFQALIALANAEPPTVPTPHSALRTPHYHFRPSVLVQQVFSILKQSPTGAIRQADLRRVAPPEISDDDVHRLFVELMIQRYLTTGRPGEWRPAPALNELIDLHEIYSNIGTDPLKGMIVDAYSGRTIAQTGRFRLEGETLLLGGKLLEVVWRDRYRIGVREMTGQSMEKELRFATQPFAVPLEVSQAIAAYLQVEPGQLPMVSDERGVWLMHFWGDLYGALLAAILQAHFQPQDETLLVSTHNGHCLRLPLGITQLPPWDAAIAQVQLRGLLPRVEPFLELGRFQSLLPPTVADRVVTDLCDLPRFERLYQAATIYEPSLALRARLLAVVGGVA